MFVDSEKCRGCADLRDRILQDLSTNLTLENFRVKLYHVDLNDDEFKENFKQLENSYLHLYIDG